MSETDRTTLLDTPELRPFLPMLYVAWADGALEPGEALVLRSQVAAQPWLKPSARLALEAWLDPDSPPTATEFARVRRVLGDAAGTLSLASRSSLVALGDALVPDGELSDETRRALSEVEEALGVDRDALIEDACAAAEYAVDGARFDAAELDVAALAQLLDGRHAEVRAQARAFLADPAHRAVYGLPKERHRAMVGAWMAELAARGVGALAYPRVTTEQRDLGAFLATFETLAMGDLSLLIKCGVQFGLFGGSIYFLGTKLHHRLLNDVASLRLPGCFAMSEVGHGSNVADLETTARYDAASDELIVHTPRESARKDWVGGAASTAHLATVFAQLEVAGEHHGIHAFLVPLRDASGALLPGVRVGDCGQKMGLNGVDNGRLWFDQVRIPRASMLDRFAQISSAGQYESAITSPGRRFFAMLGTLVGGRVSVASGAVTAAKVGLTIALRYATARRQFGPSNAPETLLLDYPTHQRRLLPALATTYAHHFAMEALRDEYLSTPLDGDTRALEAHAAGLKALATWHATRTLQLCREACGGQGYLSVNRLDDLKNDTEIFTTFEGDNTVLLQLTAKNLLGAYRARFGKGGLRVIASAIAERAAVALREKNPVTTRLSDVRHLRDPSLQRAAFAYREETLLGTAARRLKKRIDAGADAQQALLEVQEHLVALAEAHIERRVMDAFADAVEKCADTSLRGWLARLRDLHALSTLERRAAWFLEDGYFEAPKARAIRRLVPVLFTELLPAVRPLVDAFAIPDACLAAPIAFGDPAHM